LLPATPGRSSGGIGSITGSRASSAYFSSRATTSPTCSRSAIGASAPVSAIVSSIRRPISALNFAAASASSAPRSAPLMRGHGPSTKAVRAARAASFTCSIEHSGAFPATSSVAGLTMS
jgi:hypothetical protein